MSKVVVNTFTIAQLDADPALLGRYDDPSRRLKSCDEGWLAMVTTNPHATPDDAAIVVATDGNTVVGHMTLYAGRASIDGQRERIFYGQGFGIDPSYRMTAAGAMILLKALRACGCLLASGGPDENCRKLYDASRFVDLGVLSRFLYFYRATPIFGKLVGSPGLVRVLSALALPALWLYNRAKSGAIGGKLRHEYRPVATFDESIDSLIAREGRSHFPRDARTLNWILGHRSGSGFQIYRDGELAGFCMLTSSRRQLERYEGAVQEDGGGTSAPIAFGYLMDYYLADSSEESTTDLLRFCMGYFAREGVEAFDCQIMDEAMEQSCRRHGLHRRSGMLQYYKPRRGQKIDPDRSWFLTLGTGDVILWY